MQREREFESKIDVKCLAKRKIGMVYVPKRKRKIKSMSENKTT